MLNVLVSPLLLAAVAVSGNIGKLLEVSAYAHNKSSVVVKSLMSRFKDDMSTVHVGISIPVVSTKTLEILQTPLTNAKPPLRFSQPLFSRPVVLSSSVAGSLSLLLLPPQPTDITAQNITAMMSHNRITRPPKYI